MFDTLLFLLLIGLLFILFAPWLKKRFHEWQRHRKYSAIIQQIHALYQDTDPYLLSLQTRKQDSSLPNGAYGEISLCALLDLLKEIDFSPNDIFYDLGSGIGKTLLAVKLCYPTLNVQGIEIIPSLHHAALEKYQEFLTEKKSKAEDFAIKHHLDNFLEYNFSDANIIFINATGYTTVEIEALLPKLLNLAPSTKIIVTSKTLPAPAFEKTYQGMEKMSWGLTSTYIYEKKP